MIIEKGLIMAILYRQKYLYDIAYLCYYMRMDKSNLKQHHIKYRQIGYIKENIFSICYSVQIKKVEINVFEECD